jgi:hypothetical protein
MQSDDLLRKGLDLVTFSEHLENPDVDVIGPEYMGGDARFGKRTHIAWENIPHNPISEICIEFFIKVPDLIPKIAVFQGTVLPDG